MRLIPVVLVLASCGSTAGDARYEGPPEVQTLIRELDGPLPPGTPLDKLPEARLAEIGDEAVPALALAVRGPGKSQVRERAARALGLMWSHYGHVGALEAYVLAVQSAKDDDSLTRALLAQAHRFKDPEGRVFGLLETALQAMRVVSPALVAAAGAMSDVEALETMMRVVGRDVGNPSVPERDVALRYIGRAARRGRKNAVAFLAACTQSSTADLMEKAGAELGLLAGRAAPKSWRAWWFDHNAGSRREWLAEAFGPVGGQPFDPQERDHLGELVARIPEDGEAEPEIWLLELAVGHRFGYVSPRDVFDPDVDAAALAASNRRAIETIRVWWRETSPYLFWNSATGRFEVSEEGRRIGVPVDPKTGKPGR